MPNIEEDAWRKVKRAKGSGHMPGAGRPKALLVRGKVSKIFKKELRKKRELWNWDC